MIENIKELYPQIEEKMKFVEAVAEACGKKPNTLVHHWFGRFWSIPEEYQETVLKMMQNKIKLQRATVQ